jgi:hypothetical protein
VLCSTPLPTRLFLQKDIKIKDLLLVSAFYCFFFAVDDLVLADVAVVRLRVAAIGVLEFFLGRLRGFEGRILRVTAWPARSKARHMYQLATVR